MAGLAGAAAVAAGLTAIQWAPTREFLSLSFDRGAGASLEFITEGSLKDRRILGEEGFISVVIVVDHVEQTILAGPEIHARGFADSDAVFDEVVPEIQDKVLRALKDGVTEQHALAQIIRRTLGRWVSNQHRRRPMIVPVVIEG